jgi:predicted nucleic acid-binding protein
VKVLLDTNMVFDVIERRQPHYAASNHLLCLARRGALAAAVASHTVANCLYRYGRAAVPFVREGLLPHVEVAAGDAAAVREVLGLGFGDLEDALQVAAARAFQASFIVTRNVRDFRRSPVPALAPKDFLKRFFTP